MECLQSGDQKEVTKSEPTDATTAHQVVRLVGGIAKPSVQVWLGARSGGPAPPPVA